MTNTELTLDQLQAVSGGYADTRLKKSSYNVKELANSGNLYQKMKYIPGEMYRFIPGEMY